MLSHQMRTRWMIQYRETPRIPEGDQVALPREVLNIQDHKSISLVSNHLTLIHSISQCRVKKRSPDKVRTLVLALLEIGHDTVNDVGLWGEKVEGVDIAVGGTAVEDLFDVWSESGLWCYCCRGYDMRECWLSMGGC